MTTHTSVDGVSFTEDEIERWSDAAESDQGYRGKHLGPSVPGRPISVGAGARPFTLRLDAARRAKLQGIAQDRHTTPSQLMRGLIDTV